jgi:hypothetical protein
MAEVQIIQGESMTAEQEFLQEIEAEGYRLSIVNETLMISPQLPPAPMKERLEQHYDPIYALVCKRDGIEVQSESPEEPFSDELDEWLLSHCHVIGRKAQGASTVSELYLSASESLAARSWPVPASRKVFIAMLRSAGVLVVGDLAIDVRLRKRPEVW